MNQHVVIVGAGHAGGTAAILLRQFGHAGPITLVGAEPVVPYQRPPLSKAFLKGKTDAEALKLRPDVFYGTQDIELKLSTEVLSLDRSARVLTLGDGCTLSYDALILATGARPRRIAIPGADLLGVHVLRDLADAGGLLAALGAGQRLAVIGAGYIGLEVAASARFLGTEVVVIERESRVLARVASEALSSFFEAQHRANGVEFLCDADVAALEGEEGRVSAVRLVNGERVSCDAVLIGIGAQPNDELARGAGLVCANGIVVDEEARTSNPEIFAIGDVTVRPLPFYGNRSARLESVPNALEQAKTVACVITGKPRPAPEVPWFWSDQYDLKLQIAGLPFDADEMVIRGDPGKAQFAIFHRKEGRVVAVEAVGAPMEFMFGKTLIANRKVVSKGEISDLTKSMKDIAV